MKDYDGLNYEMNEDCFYKTQNVQTKLLYGDKNQGLQTIIIYRQNEDGTWNYKNNVFRVGSELD